MTYKFRKLKPNSKTSNLQKSRKKYQPIIINDDNNSVAKEKNMIKPCLRVHTKRGNNNQNNYFSEIDSHRGDDNKTS